MEDIENLIEQSSNVVYQRKFNVEEWKVKKQEEKKQTYELLDNATNEVKNDINKFRTYLDVQSKFDRYSVGNCLLIMKQHPTARIIKELNDWKKIPNVFIKKNPLYIKILEPNGEYQKQDGSIGTSYNVKKLLDISQTNVKDDNNIKYDDRILLKAIIKSSDVDMKVVEELSSLTKYDKEQNIISIKRGASGDEFFQSLIYDITKSKTNPTDNKGLDDLKCLGISYMICKKYNIDVSNYSFSNNAYDLKNMSLLDIRNYLDDMRLSMQGMNSIISQNLEMPKANRNKDYER